MLVEVTPWYAHIANYLVIGKIPRSCNRVLVGLHFSRMPMPCARVVIDVKGLGS
ncbi:hypothetical protein AAG906_035617 [Vitis piasezkii]